MKEILTYILITFSIISNGQSNSNSESDCQQKIVDLITTTEHFKNLKDSINRKYPPSGTIDISGTPMTEENRFYYTLLASPTENQKKFGKQSSKAYLIKFNFVLSYDESSGLELYWFDITNSELYLASTRSTPEDFTTGTETYQPKKKIYFERTLLEPIEKCKKN